MLTFEVADMTCAHCVSLITKTVQAVDEGARVLADLATRRVRIESTGADVASLAAAIKEAGYTPVAVNAAEMLPAAAPRRGGCCCG